MPIHDYLRSSPQLLTMPNGSIGVAQRHLSRKLSAPITHEKPAFRMKKHHL